MYSLGELFLGFSSGPAKSEKMIPARKIMKTTSSMTRVKGLDSDSTNGQVKGSAIKETLSEFGDWLRRLDCPRKFPPGCHLGR